MEQGTAEWIEFRRSRIGASDAPIIMGVSPWCDKNTLLKRKLGLIEDQFETAAMKRGKELEEEARYAFEKETGYTVFPDVIVSKNYDWMIASMDGITLDGSIALEIKCPGNKDHQSAAQGIIPHKYIPQLQHQMYVCNLKEMYYLSYSYKDQFLLKIKADDKYQIKLIEEEKNFMNHLKSVTFFKDHDICEDEKWNKLADQWKRAKLFQDMISAEMDQIKQELIKLSDGKQLKHNGVSLKPSTRKGKIDYSKIEELNDIDLEKYRSQDQEVWTLKLEGAND